jgi:hypothetical protein
MGRDWVAQGRGKFEVVSIDDAACSVQRRRILGKGLAVTERGLVTVVKTTIDLACPPAR